MNDATITNTFINSLQRIRMGVSKSKEPCSFDSYHTHLLTSEAKTFHDEIHVHIINEPLYAKLPNHRQGQPIQQQNAFVSSLRHHHHVMNSKDIAQLLTRNSSIFIILLLQSITWIFYFRQPHTVPDTVPPSPHYKYTYLQFAYTQIV